MTKTPYISLIVPVYNEEKRLPASFSKIDKFFTNKQIHIEYIFVNDGSVDKTAQILNKLKDKTKYKVKIINLKLNKGKGYALKKGVDAATGKYIMFTDADLSTPIEEFSKLKKYISKYDIVIGSRRLKESDVKISQPIHRKVLGYFFYKIFSVIFYVPVKDTNCGFKIYKAKAAKDIYKRIHNNRWGFDAEVLCLAVRYQYTIKEVPVTWLNDPYSRVSSINASITTLWELVQIKLRSALGGYEKEEDASLVNLFFSKILELIFTTVFSIIFAIFGRPDKEKAIKKVISLYEGEGFVSFFNVIRFWVAPLKRIEKQLPKKGVIVDLGSGDGLFANYAAIKSKNRKVYGIELNKDRAKVSNKNISNTNFKQGDILKAKHPKANAITLIHVLHHLPSKKHQIKAIDNCYKNLKREGKIVIVEIDEQPYYKYAITWLTDAIIVPILFEGKLYSTDFYYRNRNEWKNILKEKGYKNIRTKLISKNKPFSHSLITAVK